MKKLLGLLFFLIHIFTISFSQSNKAASERIAILNFQILGNEEDFRRYEWMSIGFSETLTDAFSRIPQFSVIERSQIHKIINEQQFQKTIQIDTNSLVTAGKILGVKKVLLGSCQIATGHLLVNMRIVNVETGEIYPIEKLPIITPIDSALFLQRKICLEVLHQFKITNQKEETTKIEQITSNSTKSMKAYEFLNKGIILFENKQYKEAVDMYTLALGHDKKYGKAYYRRGLTNYALSEYEKAADDFNKATNYLKKDTIYQLMSDAYYKQGQLKKAYDYIRMAEKLNPENKEIKKAILKFNNLPKLTNSKSTIKEDSLKYETIYEFNNGRAMVSLNKKYGFVDTSYNLVVPLIFDEIQEFSYGLAGAKIGTKCGYINYDGNWVIEPIFSQVEKFNKYKLAGVYSKTNWGVINIKGEIVIPIVYSTHYNNWDLSSDTLIRVGKSKNLGISNVWGIVNGKGKEIIPLIYDKIAIYNTSNGASYPYILVSLEGKWGVVDKTNKIIIPFKYEKEEYIRAFKNDYSAVKVNERWGFVNKKGIEIIVPQYERVNDYSAYGFEAKLKGRWGVVDTNNITLIPFMYERIEYIDKGYWAAKRNTKWGIIDSKNNIICDFSYDQMGSEIHYSYLISADFFKKHKIHVNVVKGGKKFIINEKCESIHTY